MTDLIAVLSTGKGTWAQVSALINAEQWENVHLITNEFGKDRFSCERPVNMIVIDENLDMDAMKECIIKELKGKLKMEVALNLASGTGKEHMALLAALISLGVGLRLVTEKDGLREL